jgi:hypothetical protein
MLQGFGQARMMSSKDIIFAPGDGLNPGMNAEIVVAWPRLLDSRQDGVVEARIPAYDCRTRRPTEVEQITEPAGAVGPAPVDCAIRNSPELK